MVQRYKGTKVQTPNSEFAEPRTHVNLWTGIDVLVCCIASLVSFLLTRADLNLLSCAPRALFTTRQHRSAPSAEPIYDPRLSAAASSPSPRKFAAALSPSTTTARFLFFLLRTLHLHCARSPHTSHYCARGGCPPHFQGVGKWVRSALTLDAHCTLTRAVSC